MRRVDPRVGPHPSMDLSRARSSIREDAARQLRHAEDPAPFAEGRDLLQLALRQAAAAHDAGKVRLHEADDLQRLPQWLARVAVARRIPLARESDGAAIFVVLARDLGIDAARRQACEDVAFAPDVDAVPVHGPR